MSIPAASYWQRTSPPVPLLSLDPPPSSVETAVVGGGLLGTATCYWLAREGMHVVLLEREAMASGATGRNGGFVRIGPAGSYLDASERLGKDTVRQVMAITSRSRKFLHQVLVEEAIACDYREPGSLHLAISQEQADRCRREIAELQTDGFAAAWLDRSSVQDMINVPLGAEVVGARFRPEQGLVHSARLVHGLMTAAIRRGARAYRANVLALHREGTRIRMQTAQGSILAERVVLAINAWTGQLLPGLAPFLVPVLEQMLAYETLPPAFAMGIGVDMVDGEYMQQTLSGSIVLGGCGVLAPRAGVGVWTPRPLAVVQNALEHILPRIFPSLAPHLRVSERWAGLLGCVSDSCPIVDTAPDLPGVFFVGGFSGHGMPFGMAFGRLLCEAAMSGSLPPALRPFRLDRPSLVPWETR